MTVKKSIDLAAPAVRASRIRRDPPPVVKTVTAAEIKERDAWNIVIGVVTFALSLFVILIGFNNATGPSSSAERTIHIRMTD